MLRFLAIDQCKPILLRKDVGGSKQQNSKIRMRAERLDEANGRQSREIRSHFEQDVIDGCDTNSEGEMEEVRKG